MDKHNSIRDSFNLNRIILFIASLSAIIVLYYSYFPIKDSVLYYFVFDRTQEYRDELDILVDYPDAIKDTSLSNKTRLLLIDEHLALLDELQKSAGVLGTARFALNHYDKFAVVVFIFLFYLIFLFFRFLIYPKRLICDKCYKSVLLSSVVPFLCPFCNSKNKRISSLFTQCTKCERVIPAIKCPHCKEQISLIDEYDENKINETVYGKKI